jgi:uracil-DNA glycosylase family 4
MRNYLLSILELGQAIGIDFTFDFVTGRKYIIQNNATEITKKTTKSEIANSVNCMQLDKVQTISELNNIIRNFDGCQLKKNAKNTVCGDGAVNAKIMLIGEAPGEQEDETGIPFCGKSGQLLEKALSCINLSRKENLFITNSVFWRPPNNRKPYNDEIDLCRIFVKKMIEIINPKVVILCGATAVTAILEQNTTMSCIIGKFFPLNFSINTLAFPIYHPSYLLRNPIAKRTVWDNLLILQEYIENEKLQ